MVKKIFALASVSALTGLVSAAAAAGCSSNEESKAGATDGAPPPTQVKDGGETPGKDGTGPGTRPSAECMETREIDMKRFPYSRARKTANA
ncbi:MAG: hypothetical protein KF795_31840, partial [Labilithrix sp.]|nr:hypothetical protein [Labilithrix sp.]